MRAYFLGIAGAGMSALASVLASDGAEVSGSDDGVFPPISTYLQRQGIAFHDGFDASLVPPDVDIAIVGTSAKLSLDSNPELQELVRRDVSRFSFAEYLGRHTQGRENVVITGSFGKSTLTAMCATFLVLAGKDPGYFIGAIPLDLTATGASGTDPAFLIEGDEYIVSPQDRRSKFMLYHPSHLMISSLVHDHLNVFPTIESYEAPFAELIDILPPGGKLVCAHAHPALHRLTEGREVVWYGLQQPGPDYVAEDIRIGETTRFNLHTPGGQRLELSTQLLGLHNIENIVGAAALLLELGLISPDELAEVAPRFRGVARRLDKKTLVSRAPAYEGFGSSYEKARSAIEAMQLHFPTRPLVVVFEPHTFSWRSREGLSWYDSVFQGVDRVLLLPPPGHGAGQDQLSHDEILNRISGAGIKATKISGRDDALADLKSTLTGEEAILLLSSGPLAGLADALPPVLDDRFG